MDRRIDILLNIGNANAWWNAYPDITKIAIFEDLWDIMEHEKSAG